MIRAYVMSTCNDCIDIIDQLRDDDRIEVIDIGEHVKNLKEFLRLRDNNKAFDEIRKNGYVGVPCFIKEDGSVEFDYTNYKSL